MNFEEPTNPREYVETIHVLSHKRYKIKIEVLGSNEGSSWEMFIHDEKIGDCKPSCDNTEYSVNTCNDLCKFYDCTPQLAQLGTDVISSLDATTLSFKFKFEGMPFNCLCDKSSWDCNQFDDAFDGSVEVTPILDVVNITLTEIGK